MGRLDETRRVAAAPRHWSRRGLAALYDVSERQVTSDLTLLRHGLHWQIRSDHAGYYFAPVPELPGAQFPLPEALAFLLAVRASMALPGVASSDLAAPIAPRADPPRAPTRPRPAPAYPHRLPRRLNRQHDHRARH
jgi:predicted DNA-binding transcriptional regulator YafY